MQLVIIESPYAGDIERNVRYARACVLDALRRGESPIASHLLLTQVLDDSKPDERLLGIEAGLAWTQRCDKQVFCVDLGISKGMRIALERCVAECRPREMRSIGFDWEKNT